MKKRIAIVGTAYPYRGGLAVYNERLAREFQDEGYEVIIYTFTLQYPNFLFPGKTQYSTSAAPDDLHIVRKVNSINPFTLSLLFLLENNGFGLHGSQIL